ncbi:hypothetical protein RND81_11G084900 [Saponaria officinalis]|uniref:Replication factor A C-terminal domain-containing protein n=1 Tax=Saponaria officinalis TaxID=3572 RepID=A0AAW1HJJ5_SAPOF
MAPRGQRVRVVLWDHCLAEYKEQKAKHSGSDEAIIVIVTSLMVKDYKGFNSISTSTSSRLYINLDIPDVNTLREYLRGQRVIVVLWDHCLAEYKEQKAKHSGSDEAIIVIVTSLMVKDYKGFNSISTSTSSRLYINLDIPDVNTLREYLRGQRVRVVLWDHCLAEYKEQKAKHSGSDEAIIVIVTSLMVKDYKGFNSISTSTSSRLYIHLDIPDVNTLREYLRYCFELKVEDHNSSTNFVIFDKEAKQLIGQDAVSLYDSQQDEDEDDEDYNPIPILIYNSFVGKQFLFKLKIQDTNHGINKRTSYKVIDLSERKSLEVHDFESTSSQQRRQESLINCDVNESLEQDSECSETVPKIQNKKRKTK